MEWDMKKRSHGRREDHKRAMELKARANKYFKI